MPPRKKPTQLIEAPALPLIDAALAASFAGGPLTIEAADALIAEYLQNKQHIEAQTKAFQEFCKPFRDRMDAIESRFLAAFNAQSPDQKASIATSAGTAYRSILVTPKVEQREAYIDFCMEHWDSVGNAMFQVGAPQKDALQDYQDKRREEIEAYKQQHGVYPENPALLPPGVSTSSFARVNIRRS